MDNFAIREDGEPPMFVPPTTGTGGVFSTTIATPSTTSGSRSLVVVDGTEKLFRQNSRPTSSHAAVPSGGEISKRAVSQKVQHTDPSGSETCKPLLPTNVPIEQPPMATVPIQQSLTAFPTPPTPSTVAEQRTIGFEHLSDETKNLLDEANMLIDTTHVLLTILKNNYDVGFNIRYRIFGNGISEDFIASDEQLWELKRLLEPVEE